MGSQVKIKGNGERTKTVIHAPLLVPFFIVLTSQQGPYRYISSQALCTCFINLRNHVFRQQQLTHTKLDILQATLGAFRLNLTMTHLQVSPLQVPLFSTTSCSVLEGCAHHARGRFWQRCLKSSNSHLKAWHWLYKMAMVVGFWILVLCPWTYVLSTDYFLIRFSGFLYRTVTAVPSSLWFQHALIAACPNPYLHLANNYLLKAPLTT